MIVFLDIRVFKLKINFICTSGKSNFLDAGIGHLKRSLILANELSSDVILLRNMKEGKQKATKATVGVISPIMSEDCGKFLPHYELVSSNIIPFGYTTMDDFNSELLLFKRK